MELNGAAVIKVDGTVYPVTPRDGKYFQADEVKRYTESDDIELIWTSDGRYMYIDGEGLGSGKKNNEKATAMASPEFLWRLNPAVIGTALICSGDQIEWD